MNFVKTIETHLAGFREGLVADGYDIRVDDFADGIARLRITAGGDACAECLVPKNVMVPMLESALKEIPEIRHVDVVYPNE